MFTSSFVSFNTSSGCSGFFYEDGYLAATNLNHAGIDGQQEYYFICNNSEKETREKVLNVHSTNSSDPLELASTSYIEDPVLLSPAPKYALFLREPFGHFILNNVAIIAKLHKENKDAVFLIFNGIADKEEAEDKEVSNRSKLIEFLKDFFFKNNIMYYFVKTISVLHTFTPINRLSLAYSSQGLEPNREVISNYLIYRVKNVTTVHTFNTTNSLSVVDIKNLIDEYVIEKFTSNQEPQRKIYITRKNYKSEPEPFNQYEGGSIGYKSDAKRIYDEHLVEEYMESKGFDVLDIESLSSVEEQIEIMSSAAIVVGSTGTGLINQLFMKDSQVLVELRVELGQLDQIHRIVPEYYYLSTGKQHFHFVLDVRDKQAATAIDKLDQLFQNLDLDGLIKSRKGLAK